MAATPGDETEQVIEAPKDAFVQGRLGKQEFDKRVGAAFAASAVLRALTADIPAAPSDAAAPDAVPSALLTLLLWALESPDRRARPAAEVTA